MCVFVTVRCVLRVCVWGGGVVRPAARLPCHPRRHTCHTTDTRLFSHTCSQAEFFADMDALGVRRPDVLTRVVEYMPEIIEYVQVRSVTLWRLWTWVGVV